MASYLQGRIFWPLSLPQTKQRYLNQELNGLGGAGVIIHWIGCLPCTWLVQVRSLASHMVSGAPPEMISEFRALRSKSLALSGGCAIQKKLAEWDGREAAMGRAGGN